MTAARLPLLVAALLLALAATMGVRTTAGLRWPDTDWTGVGVDLYRDIAAAQALRDAGYGPDAAYRGERAWYNPLAPALTATVSAWSGRDVPTVATQIGAYANLLAPVALLALAWRLFDPWTATCALAAFLVLLNGPLPGWVSATYTPWFLPVSFVQGLFYLTLLAAHEALTRQRLGWYVLTGALWGVTFLGHTGPALILGGMAVTWVAWSAWRGGDAGLPTSAVAARAGLMAAAAVVVSLPFLAIIAGHYGLRLVHRGPTEYSYPLLSRELPRLIVIHLTVPVAIAVAGTLALWRGAGRDVSRRLVLAWTGVAAALLAYSSLRIAARYAGVTLPAIVPSFHYFFYLKAAMALLFGVGVTTLAEVADRSPGWPAVRPPLVALGATLGMVVLGLPAYLARVDFAPARQLAATVMDSPQEAAYHWLRANAGRDDVVLAELADAALVVVPSGTKTVATFAGFSNPYVDFARRRDAMARMFATLDTGQPAAFYGAAGPYDVGWVLTTGERSARYAAAPPVPLVDAFAAGPYRIYRVRRTH